MMHLKNYFLHHTIILILLCLFIGTSATPVLAKKSEIALADFSSRSLRTSESAYMEALIKIQENDFKSATIALQKAISLDPENLFLKRELASLYFSQGDFTSSAHLLKDILKNTPDDDEIWYLLGRSYQVSDRTQAEIAYKKAISLNSKLIEAHFYLASIYLDEKKPENAIRSLNKVIEITPNSFLGYYYLGQAYLLQNDLERAKNYLNQAFQKNPNVIDPMQALLGIARLENNLSEAIKWFKAIETINPKDIRSRIELAFFLGFQNRNQEAKEILCVISGDQYQNEIIRVLRLGYILTNRIRETVYCLELLVECGAQFSQYDYFLAYGWKRLNNTQRSLNYLEKIPITSDIYKEVLLQLAYEYLAQGRPQDAALRIQQAFHQGIGVNNENLYSLLILSHEELGEKDKALLIAEKALIRFPNNESIWFQKGMILNHLNRPQDALSAMNQVLLLNPNHAEALNYIGYYYAENGIQLAEAEALIQRAISISPQSPHILDSLGWVYYKQGRYEEAFETLEKSLSIRQNEPEIFEHAGDAAVKVKNYPKAIQYYQKALELSPMPSEKLYQKLENLKKQL